MLNQLKFDHIFRLILNKTEFILLKKNREMVNTIWFCIIQLESEVYFDIQEFLEILHSSFFSSWKEYDRANNFPFDLGQKCVQLGFKSEGKLSMLKKNKFPLFCENKEIPFESKSEGNFRVQSSILYIKLKSIPLTLHSVN